MEFRTYRRSRARAVVSRRGLVALLVSSCAGVATGQAPGASASDDEGAQANRLEPVTVTGSRLVPATAQTAQDVRTYDRKRIERSSQSTVADFLATVPEVSLNS